MKSCCDTYCMNHGCNQGDECPARIVKLEEEAPFSFQWAADLIWGFLAALGLIAAAGMVGLYFGGFFHWAAQKLPDNAVLRGLMGMLP